MTANTSSIADELLLHVIRPELAEGEAMDSHGTSFYPSAQVRAAPIEDVAAADAVVVAAGRGGRPGETRIQLLRENAESLTCIAVVHPLNSAGKFAEESATSPFVIQHTYLDEFTYTDEIARDGLRIAFHSRHRPIQAYSRALEAAGLVIETVRELGVPAEAIRSDRSRRWQRIPLFLHLRGRKHR
jgi:lactate/malate dehydrogenase, NAD binding domain